MTAIDRRIFLRGLRSWLNYNGVHPADLFWAIFCAVAFVLTLAWPRPEFTPKSGPCRAVVYDKPTSATAYYGTFNEAGECVILRKVNKP